MKGAKGTKDCGIELVLELRGKKRKNEQWNSYFHTKHIWVTMKGKVKMINRKY